MRLHSNTVSIDRIAAVWGVSCDSLRKTRSAAIPAIGNAKRSTINWVVFRDFLRMSLLWNDSHSNGLHLLGMVCLIFCVRFVRMYSPIREIALSFTK